ncbi:hypothetical protein AAC387_Pa10g1215 [Persea americana]
MGEEVSRLTVEYKAQLPGIRDRVWELGWKATLKKAGVPRDNPIFRNPPRFPRTDSELLAISSPLLPGPSSQACPRVNATSEAPFEVAPKATVPEDSAVIPEAISAAVEASAVVTETLPEIDCNVEDAVL